VPNDRGNLLREALEAARLIGDEGHRAQALSAVAQHLDPAGLKDIASEVHALIDQSAILESLVAIAEHWPEYIRKRNRASDDELAYWLSPLSRETRGRLLATIRALLPAIEHAGGKLAILETGKAIEDAGRWWP
jgi:hypothetical protein